MDRVVTFGCSKSVHVFPEKCGWSPMWPYRSHSDIESATKYLISCGIENPKIEIHQIKRK